MKVLLELKAEFKKVSGKDWKPGMTPAAPAPSGNSGAAGDLDAKITAQGNKVRELKSAKADKVRKKEHVLFID